MSSSVEVATFYSQTEALIAAEYLRANGLVVTVMGDDAGGAFSGLTLSKGFRIYVPQADKHVAIELLENPPSEITDQTMGEPADLSSPDAPGINQVEY